MTDAHELERPPFAHGGTVQLPIAATTAAAPEIRRERLEATPRTYPWSWPSRMTRADWVEK
jgi:hypothetical protein